MGRASTPFSTLSPDSGILLFLFSAHSQGCNLLALPGKWHLLLSDCVMGTPLFPGMVLSAQPHPAL